ncbi:MAG TPA: hypothetical protein VF209_00505 [Patescibacteria group bacterium]
MISQEIKSAALDIDGTLSDPKKIEPEYAHIVTGYLAYTLSMDYSETETKMAAALTTIHRDPGAHGWRFPVEGKRIIVAPPGDPYILYQEVAELLIRTLKSRAHEGRLTPARISTIVGDSDQEMDQFLNEMYRKCSTQLKKIDAFFREGTFELLTELNHKLKPENVSFVTNGGEQSAYERLITLPLGTDVRDQIIGGARKFDVNRNWIEIAEPGPYMNYYFHHGGYARGVELQRQFFHDKLLKVGHGSLDGMLILEDFFEFVALYHAHFDNVIIGLMVSSFTQEWEKDLFASDDQRLWAITSFNELLTRLQSFPGE